MQTSGFKAAHAGYPVEQSRCGECHGPHSSSHPKLMRESVHPPMLAKQCNACHGDAAGAKPLAVS
ncbi:MAG: hypothetical protein GTO49_33100, partial [Anaerolineae bacterium]|nr:hypothetical protein [Anaerolineae bacterium]